MPNHGVRDELVPVPCLGDGGGDVERGGGSTLIQARDVVVVENGGLVEYTGGKVSLRGTGDAARDGRYLTNGRWSRT